MNGENGPFLFAIDLNSQTRQVAADRAWSAISRFYENCTNKKPGKKGYPTFQHDNRSVEYKTTGWRLEPNGKHIVFTDGCGIGQLRMVGTRDLASIPLPQIRRVRLVRRADGYYVQFGILAQRQVNHVPTGGKPRIRVNSIIKQFVIFQRERDTFDPLVYVSLRRAEKNDDVLSRRHSADRWFDLWWERPISTCLYDISLCRRRNLKGKIIRERRSNSLEIEFIIAKALNVPGLVR
jgi:putative transposase